MTSIHNAKLKRNDPPIFLYTVVIITFFLSACAYRLSNLHVQSPNKIESIAIEAIFDTSGQVIAHDQLWSELQRAFAANGHLKVASVGQADALLRAHLRSAAIANAGDRIQANITNKKDPDLYAPGAPPLGPNQLRDLSAAGDYFTKDQVSMVIDIEVWNLRTHELILQRSYGGSFAVLNVRAEGEAINELVSVRREESADRGVAGISRQIAGNVVSDLLIR